MSMCVGMCTGMQVPTEARENKGFPGAGDIGGCVPYDMGTGN